MDVEKALLSKIIRDRDVLTAVNARITPQFFNDDKWRRVFEFVVEHWRKYNTSPDLATVALDFPTYTWSEEDQTIEYFIDKLRERRHRTILVTALSDAAGLMESSDPRTLGQMDEILQRALIQVRVETTPTTDLNLRTALATVEEILTDRMDDPGYLRGISSGFKGIDRLTGGWQPEQFIVLIGLPKAMKSSTLLYMAMMCHLQARVPLFLGFEMSNGEQLDRLMSLYGKVGLTKVMTGKISQNEYNRIISSFKRLEGMRDFVTSQDMDNGMTLSGVQAKIMEFNPDVVFIDAAYLMQSEVSHDDPGSAAALTDIARGLKKLSQAQRISIVATTQATETRTRGGKLRANSAMYTQAWRQSADVLLGVEREDPEADDHGEVLITVRVLDSRSGPRGSTTMSWDWTTGVVLEIDAADFATARARGVDDDVA
jgi:replicative DNA helicase